MKVFPPLKHKKVVRLKNMPWGLGHSIFNSDLTQSCSKLLKEAPKGGL